MLYWGSWLRWGGSSACEVSCTVKAEVSFASWSTVATAGSGRGVVEAMSATRSQRKVAVGAYFLFLLLVMVFFL